MLMERDGIAGTAGGAAASPPANDVKAWAHRERRLSEATLERLGVASGTTFFPDLGRKSPALFFRYRSGWKARAVPEKSFVSGGGFKLDFFNIEAVLNSDLHEVFIVEGELDAAALVESGVDADRVLSVPNGAKTKAADEPKEQRGYAYVEEALSAGLSRSKRFVWCGDNDPSGHALRADMVRLLGAARFWFVDWPEGCKDANDMLRHDGPQALKSLVTEGALPWPVNGLYRLFEMPEPAPLTLWQPGFELWERKVMLAPRTLSVVTGHPGHGKTALWCQIWQQVVRVYGLVACIASFETRPKPHLRRQLRSLYCGRLEKECSTEELATADRWINDHYLFMAHPEHRPTLEWFLDMAEVAVIRHGARIIQADPWNRFDGARSRDETETDYIGRALKALFAFAHDMNCHVQIVAHPAKMDSSRRGQRPRLEDISGSKNWENMVDQGFVVHRPKIFDGANRRTEACLYHEKARFEELGFPCKFDLNYRVGAGNYVPTSEEQDEQQDQQVLV
jgi:twinkle protein